LSELAERYAAATLILIVLASIAVTARFVWGNRRA